MLLVGEHLRHDAARFPAKVALIDTRGRITRSDLNRLANRLARGLATAGCRRGDRVAFLGDSRIEWVAASLVASLAASHLGSLERPAWLSRSLLARAAAPPTSPRAGGRCASRSRG